MVFRLVEQPNGKLEAEVEHSADAEHGMDKAQDPIVKEINAN
jgi:hypothetical protein